MSGQSETPESKWLQRDDRPKTNGAKVAKAAKTAHAEQIDVERKAKKDLERNKEIINPDWTSLSSGLYQRANDTLNALDDEHVIQALYELAQPMYYARSSGRRRQTTLSVVLQTMDILAVVFLSTHLLDSGCTGSAKDCIYELDQLT
ncbi:hypothetical protein PENSPDRAFT_694132 [Peniophora sp. CONT]|nr:hypothetical protein PENSPDRAFT_694132 [Peniophora sp. CONT]